MKRVIMALAAVASLFVATVALACPQKCVCNSNGTIVYDGRNTNTNVNGNNNSNSNTQYGAPVTQSLVNNNSNQSNSNSSANSGSVSSATGGNSYATGGSATGGSVSGSGNSTNNVSAGNSSATIQKGAVKNNVTVSPTNNNNVTVSPTITANPTATATGGSVAAGAVKNTNNNTATGGAGGQGGAGGTASAVVAAGAVQSSQSQTQSQTASNENSGNNTGNGGGAQVTQNYEAAKIPVATAYSAALTSGMDTCLGSASGGVQIPVVGLSLGGTKVDQNCVLIKQVQLLHALGQDEAACYRARAGKEGKMIDDAMNKAGVSCKPTPPPAPVVIVTPAPDTVTHAELTEHENRIVTKVLQK